MAQFESTKQKLRKIFERLQRNKIDLKNINYKILNLNFESFLNTPFFTIFESDWQTSRINFNDGGVVSHISQGQNIIPVSHEVFYEYIIPEITIPQDYLPFLEVSIDTKLIPTMTTLALDAYDRLSYVQRQQILVNDIKIYEGPGRSNKFRYNQSHINSGEVFFENLKRIFFVTNGIESGYITRIRITYDTVTAPSPCGAFENFKEFLIDYNGQSLHEIISLTTSSVTGIASVFQHTRDGSCIDQITTLVDKEQVTQSFSGVDSITFDIERTNETTTAFTSLDTVTDTPKEYWLYFNSDKTTPRVGFQTVSGDDKLLELPTDDVGEIQVIPIAFESHQTVLNVGEKTFGYLKISKSNENLERWLMRLRGSFLVSGIPLFESESNIISPSEKLNIYTKSGMYTETSTIDVTELKPLYRLPDQDVQWRVRLTFKNPFFNKSIST